MGYQPGGKIRVLKKYDKKEEGTQKVVLKVTYTVRLAN